MNTQSNEASLLPALREDLQIMAGTRQLNGLQSWVIFDPLRHRYFQISFLAVQIMNHWRKGSAEVIAAELKKLDIPVAISDIEDLENFLYLNNLTLEARNGDAKSFAAQAMATKKTWLQQAVHGYLFFRIPLVRPHAFLKRTLPYVAFFYSRNWMTIVVLVGLLGLYLTMRQWDEYVRTFVNFFNFKGMLLYGFSLVFVKIAHELGHAYSATRYGCRVSVMGVALLVMFPVLYTDTTDSWRITSRRQRLIIDASGVIVELMIATFATFMWAFLPDGFWRSVAFFTATTSWILSISVNANPLMRFDGYYFISDAIGMPNLQSRTFALGKWALREFLFKLKHPVPEIISPKRRNMLILFAWATWIYRFFLFLGIALLVYNFFFKALGVVLFFVEIYWFIAMPIFRELKEWIKMRDEIFRSRRTLFPLAMLTGLLLLLLVPWSTTIRIPAVQETSEQHIVHAQYPGVISSIHVSNGNRVEKGDLMIEVESPKLDFERLNTKKRISVLLAQLGRITVDYEDREQTIVLQRKLIREQERLQGLSKQILNLNIYAPITGRITDLDANLHPQRWINSNNPLAIVVTDSGIRVRGYVQAEDVERLNLNDAATFIPDNHQLPILKGRVIDVSRANAKTITIPELASRNGGEISVSESQSELQPLGTWYALIMEVNNDKGISRQIIRGEIHAVGKAESFAKKIWRQTMRILVRESSV